jgi:hypothetical protein
MNQQRALFYNFTIDNTLGNEEKLLDQVDTPYTEMLPKASDYNVSVIKFTLPNEAETFLIEDNSYSVQISFRTPTQLNQINAYDRVSRTESMSLRSVFKIRSISDFLENLNRALIRCHGFLLDAMSLEHPCPYTAPGAPQVRVLSSTATIAEVHRILPISLPQLERTLRYSRIKVFLQILSCSRPEPQMIQVYLVNHAGVSVCLTGGKKLVVNQQYEFTDASMLRQPDIMSTPGAFQPIEPFSKILTSNDVGSSSQDWVLVFRTAGQFNYNILYSVQLSQSPVFSYNSEAPSALISASPSYFPYIAPAFQFNPETKQVSMILQDRQDMSSYTVGFSPRLYDAMPFDGVLVNGFYELSIPQAAFLSNGDPALPDYIETEPKFFKSFTYPSPYPSLVYRLLDINTIIISTGLAVAAEQESSTNARTLMTLDVSGSDFFNNLYQFVSNQLSTRTYPLLSDEPLRQIGMSVSYKYRSSNKVERAYLPPRTLFSMLLKFTPNGVMF